MPLTHSPATWESEEELIDAGDQASIDEFDRRSTPPAASNKGRVGLGVGGRKLTNDKFEPPEFKNGRR